MFVFNSNFSNNLKRDIKGEIFSIRREPSVQWPEVTLKNRNVSTIFIGKHKQNKTKQQAHYSSHRGEKCSDPSLDAASFRVKA